MGLRVAALLAGSLAGVCQASECRDKYDVAGRACLAAVEIASRRETTRFVDLANRARQQCLEAFSEKSGAEVIGSNLYLDQLLRRVLTGQVKADSARDEITRIVADRRKLCS